MDTTERFKEYLSLHKQHSPLTVKAYIEDTEALRLFLDGTAIEQCTVADIRAFLMSEVESGRNPRSINRRISSLRTLFNYLIKDGRVTVNPLAKIKSLKSTSRLPNFVTEGEIAPLIEELEREITSSEPAPLGYTTACRSAVILVLYFTGLRRAEVESLTLDSLDISSRTIKVTGKGGKERLVPISERLMRNLAVYMEKRGEINCNSQSNSLFLKYNKSGTLMPIKASDIYEIVKSRLSSVATDARTSPHTLRHTFATHLLSQGVGIRSIQELLGHSSIASTQIYSHNTIESLKQSHKMAHPRARGSALHSDGE